MGKKSLAALAILATAALAAAGSAFSHTSSTPTLKGVVGPGYSIKLTKGGKKVESLKAGTYRFVISDRSNFHNFTVEREKPSKPKIEKHHTATAFTGTKTVVMTLKRGSWSFYCSNHEAQMHGDFKVTLR
jgi:plastocyanin